MPYTLQRLAPGSYDLMLNGEIVGGVVRNIDHRGDAEAWLAELLDASEPMPAPFERDTHEFRTLDVASRWLGIASDGEAD